MGAGAAAGLTTVAAARLGLSARGVSDRVVHRFYKLTTEGGRARLTADAADAAAVLKKTIEIETR